MHKGMSVGYPINASQFIKIQALNIYSTHSTPLYVADVIVILAQSNEN